MKVKGNRKIAGQFALLLGLLLTACHPATKKDQPTNNKADTNQVSQANNVRKVAATGSFHDAYALFVDAVVSKDAKAFNQFISPEHHLNIIESGGAMPHITIVKDINDFKTLSGKSFFDMKTGAIRIPLVEGPLPKVDCNSRNFYDKTGCFNQAVNPLKDSKIWKYCSLNKSDENAVAAAAQTVTQTVINTAGYRYYFSKINGAWYLTFIDMRVPCNA